MAPCKPVRVATLEEAREHTLEELLALGLIPPIAGGAEDDATSEKTAETDDKPAEADDTAEDDDADDVEDDDKSKASEPNWKQMARKHEREAKKRQRELDALKEQLRERTDAEKTEQERAIEQAKKDAVSDLQAQHERERRQDRLEVASTKLAARGIKLGDGEKAKTLKFADPDDALVYLERDIASGKLDEEDLFDDRGRVKDNELIDALSDVLERKPHLASDSKPASKVKGTADSGKGDAPKTDGSVDDHFKKIRRTSPQQQPSFVVSRQQ